MSFPRQRIEDIENTIMLLTQEQARKIMDVMRVLALMIEDITNKKGENILLQKYNEILKIDEECKKLKHSTGEQIMRIGSLLQEREDFIRLISCLDKISDKAEGAAFRLLSLQKLGFHDDNIYQRLSELSDNVFVAVEKLKEAILAITLDSSVLYSKLMEIEEQERKVDELFRKLDIMLLQSKLSVPHLLLMREITHMLEDIADKSEEITNIIKALFPQIR
jgi:uncharacterized protein Yka (UPF0111/DUF47 family)